MYPGGQFDLPFHARTSEELLNWTGHRTSFIKRYGTYCSCPAKSFYEKVPSLKKLSIAPKSYLIYRSLNDSIERPFTTWELLPYFPCIICHCWKDSPRGYHVRMVFLIPEKLSTITNACWTSIKYYGATLNFRMIFQWRGIIRVGKAPNERN